jgi:hypothetical protein
MYRNDSGFILMTIHLFISYSRKDAEFARRLALSLSDAGADIWLDVEDIPAGVKWSTAVQQGLLQADIMLVIISPDSMKSKNVEDEWQYFLDMNKPIIPVLWKPAALHFQLSRVQYVDFHSHAYNVALFQLLTQIRYFGCEINIPPYLEKTRRKLSTMSNAHPTHARPPTRPIPEATLIHRKPRRMLWMFLLALTVAGLFAVISQPAAPSGISTSVPTPTAKPPRVTITTSANVRAEDHTGAQRIAILRVGEKAEIIGVNHSGTWWFIRFEISSGTQEGWVADVVVQTRGDTDSVPVIQP